MNGRNIIIKNRYLKGAKQKKLFNPDPMQTCARMPSTVTAGSALHSSQRAVALQVISSSSLTDRILSLHSPVFIMCLGSSGIKKNKRKNKQTVQLKSAHVLCSKC